MPAIPKPILKGRMLKWQIYTLGLRGQASPVACHTCDKNTPFSLFANQGLAIELPKQRVPMSVVAYRSERV
jgi:hypothetical protein